MFHVNKEQTAAVEEEASRNQPFLVQYTPDASTQLSSLAYDISTMVQEKLSVIAAVDPHAHGHVDPMVGHRDRRIVAIEDVRVTFWISVEVHVVTVMRIQQDGDETSWTDQRPDPTGLVKPPHLGPFSLPDDDGDEEPETSAKITEAGVR